VQICIYLLFLYFSCFFLHRNKKQSSRRMGAHTYLSIGAHMYLSVYCLCMYLSMSVSYICILVCVYVYNSS
jgi:hypothetical protein